MTMIDFHSDVNLCNQEPTWEHVPGTEWLAADPCTIPRLQSLLEECIPSQDESDSSTKSQDPVPDRNSSTEEPVTPNRYATRSATQRTRQYASQSTAQSTARRTSRSTTIQSAAQSTGSKTQDPFLHLSIETRSTVIKYLQDDLDAVANLRLSSRAFKVLPQFFYRTLVTKLMPWVWEVHVFIAENRTMDWQRLWKDLCRADGILLAPTERKGIDDENEEDYHFSREPGQKKCRVYKNEYDEVPAEPGSELWEKAAKNYVKADTVTVLGLRNRARI